MGKPTINRARAGQPTGTGFRRLLRVLCRVLPLLVSLLLLLTAITPVVHAETDDDREMLGLFYEPQDLDVTTATRSAKPLSRSAENITVITAEEIEALNAHTLAEVLNRVTGIQVDLKGAFGSDASFELQGNGFRHVMVLLDGVVVNDLLDNAALVGLIPVQNIERVEVVKGPVSSSWGSALAGVVSVVTKSPRETGRVGGSASFSGGENGTRDGRAELSGTVGPLGYYLSGGNLRSDGFRPNSGTDNNHIYTKLRWLLPNRATAQFTLAWLKATIGEYTTPIIDLSSNISQKHLISTLSLDYPVTDRLTLALMLKTTFLDYEMDQASFSSGLPVRKTLNDEKTLGASLLATWRQGMHTVVGGIDMDHNKADTTVTSWDSSVIPPIQSDQQLLSTNDKYGIFLNDTIAWQDLTITPAVRYDRTSRGGEFTSPSLGVTYSLTDKTLLRAYGAQGYSLPRLDNSSSREHVWTVQAGFESTEIPYLWFKGTWFRNFTWNIDDYDADGNPIHAKQVREGFEAEARTAPLFNTWLTAGYAFIDTRNADTDEIIKDIPRQTWDLGIHYDDRNRFRGAFTGHYVWWNASDFLNARYKDFIWDLNLGCKLFRSQGTEGELFFTGHNLFNGKQYSDEILTNPRRWVEGGIRFKF